MPIPLIIDTCYLLARQPMSTGTNRVNQNQPIADADAEAVR